MVTVVEPISPRHRQHRTAGNSFAQRNRRLSDDWFIGHCSPAIERSAGTDYAWNILYQGDLFNAVAATYNTPNGVFNPGQDSMLAPNPGMQMVGLSAYSQPQGFWGFYAQHEQRIQAGVAVTAGVAASLASFGILAPEAGAGIAAVIAAQAASGAAGGFITGYLESGFNGGSFTQNLEAGTINGGIGAALGGGFGAAGGLVGSLLERTVVPVAEGVTPGTGVMFGGDWNAYFAEQDGTTNVEWANPASAVDTQALLTAKVAEAEAILLANPFEAAVRRILSIQQAESMVLGGRLAAASYGRAVEGVAAQLAEEDPLTNPYLVYVARTHDLFTGRFVTSPDFIGIEGNNLRALDVTTWSDVSSHRARGWVSAQDIVIQCGLPW